MKTSYQLACRIIQRGGIFTKTISSNVSILRRLSHKPWFNSLNTEISIFHVHPSACTRNILEVTKNTNYRANNNLKKFCQMCTDNIDMVTYSTIVDETLESLSDHFEELLYDENSIKDADILFTDGVLTIKLGNQRGTYVINKQTPNKQIWLSSPISGPKRYDYIGGKWIYRHNDQSLHQLLDDELSQVFGKTTKFNQCSHGPADDKS
ncbi:FXN (predicted) [Pycnogonum litorale]